MKLFPMITLVLLSCSAFAQKKSPDKFIVKGKLERASKTKLYLTEAKKVSFTYYQDSTITDAAGNFSFTGSIPEPRLFIIAIGRQRQMMDELSFFVDKKNIISINGYADSLAFAKITGSDEDALAKAFIAGFNKKITAAHTENIKLYNAAKAKNDSTAMLREGKIADRKNIETTAELITDFVTAHPSSAASIEFLNTLIQYSRLSTADSLLQLIEKTPAGNYAAAKLLRKTVNIQKSVIKGYTAPIFSQPDMAGHAVSLASLKGKYVLVDFWASWCGPCRAENPNVLKAYNKFKDKNFTILAVSLDNDKASWLKAIKDDKLPWTQVSDLKGFENAAAKLYGVKAIPSNFLIDPAGKIVASNLRGEELEKVLASTIN